MWCIREYDRYNKCCFYLKRFMGRYIFMVGLLDIIPFNIIWKILENKVNRKIMKTTKWGKLVCIIRLNYFEYFFYKNMLINSFSACQKILHMPNCLVSILFWHWSYQWVFFHKFYPFWPSIVCSSITVDYWFFIFV